MLAAAGVVLAVAGVVLAIAVTVLAVAVAGNRVRRQCRPGGADGRGGLMSLKATIGASGSLMVAFRDQHTPGHEFANGIPGAGAA